MLQFLFLLLVFSQVTVYQCLEGGVIAVLQSYVDEDVCEHIYPLVYVDSLSLIFHFLYSNELLFM